MANIYALSFARAFARFRVITSAPELSDVEVATLRDSLRGKEAKGRKRSADDNALQNNSNHPVPH